MKPSQDQRIYEFGKFRLDSTRRLVEREGEPLPLTPKMVETLLALIERASEVVDKDTLMERVWPGTFVEESNLTYNISVLRKVLRGNDGDQSYIETLPRRGYRFICPVKELSVSESSQASIAGEERSVLAPNNRQHLGASRDEAQHLPTVSGRIRPGLTNSGSFPTYFDCQTVSKDNGPDGRPGSHHSGHCLARPSNATAANC